MTNVGPEDPIELFARLCALLDDATSAREEILSAAGLDEGGWRLLCARWLPQLAAGDAPEFSLSFAPAYARARRYPGGIILPHASPVLGSAVPAQIAEDDTVADAAPRIAPDPDLTVEGAFPLAAPALPFQRATIVPPAPPSDSPMILPAAAAPIGATLPLPCAAPGPGAVLPFSAPTADGRLIRLQRFDPETGATLSVPRWVDDAELSAPPR